MAMFGIYVSFLGCNPVVWSNCVFSFVFGVCRCFLYQRCSTKMVGASNGFAEKTWGDNKINETTFKWNIWKFPRFLRHTHIIISMNVYTYIIGYPSMQGVTAKPCRWPSKKVSRWFDNVLPWNLIGVHQCEPSCCTSLGDDCVEWMDVSNYHDEHWEMLSSDWLNLILIFEFWKIRLIFDVWHSSTNIVQLLASFIWKCFDFPKFAHPPQIMLT